MTYLSINFIFSVLLAIGSRIFLAGSFKENPWIFYLFIFSLGFFIPVFGEIIGIFIIISIYRKHTKFHEHTEVLYNPINLLQIKPIHAKYGSGGGALQLLNPNASTNSRTAALFKMAQSPLSEMNTLLYQLLPDSSDEIRLLAFNILDEQESRITQSINELQVILSQENLNQETYAMVQKNIANLYWDLVNNQLIIHELEDTMLEKARAHGFLAIKILANDASLWALLGKIYNRLKQYSQAEEALNKASALNIVPAKVKPYLAEIYFKRQDYIAVAHALSTPVSLMDITLIAPVKRFWDKE